MATNKLDALQLDQTLIKAGFPATDYAGTTSPLGLYVRRTAWAKAMAESGGYADIVSLPNPNGSQDYGLFQINDKAHRAGLGEANWAKILDPAYNASLAWQWSGSGKNWSTWGLGLQGWAGSLHESNLAAWSQIQQVFQTWYDRYPQAIADAKVIQALPGVELDLLKPMSPGQPPRPDVKKYQLALRVFLTKVGRLGSLNPNGATGFYGKETMAMTDAVYRYQAAVTHNVSWLKEPTTEPGRQMLNVIGLRDLP